MTEDHKLLGRSEPLPFQGDPRLMQSGPFPTFDGCTFTNHGHGVVYTNAVDKKAAVGKSEDISLASVQKAMKSVQRMIDEAEALPPGFSLDNADMRRVMVPPDFPMPPWIKTRIV